MRKLRSFASLTEQELNQVAQWAAHEPYDLVIERVARPRPEGFGLKVSRSPLQRLKDKVLKVEKINSRIASGQRLSLSEFEAIDAGEKTDVPQEIHDATMTTAHELAASDENNPAQLLALQRLADFPERADYRAHKKEMDEHRKYIADERLGLGKSRLQLAKQLAEKKLNAIAQPAQEQKDDLGPYAETDDDVSERLRIQFGISKEEAARRAALCNAALQAASDSQNEPKN